MPEKDISSFYKKLLFYQNSTPVGRPGMLQVSGNMCSVNSNFVFGESCQPELVEGGFKSKKNFSLRHRLRQAQADRKII